MFLGLILLISLIGFSTYFVLKLIKYVKPTSDTFEKLVIFAYLMSNFLFAIGMLFHGNQYNIALDPTDGECYIPFGEKHIYSLLFYYIIYGSSTFLLWAKEDTLPPIPKVLALVFLLIGSVISLIIIFQLASHDTSTLDIYKSDDSTLLFFAPICNILISIALFIKTLKSNKNYFNKKKYRSKFLNHCNKTLTSTLSLQLWAIILLIPITFICTVILILFGQDSNSMIKVFTETATWTFSQKQHPPVLDHTGHYLCTVAATGNPAIVKPLFIGKRHNNPIIVNRQLQVANAFEELIAEQFPKLHYVIRKNYDKYGFNLSLVINSKKSSNYTYLIMKPLEYLFLCWIYCFSSSPETKIQKQYR